MIGVVNTLYHSALVITLDMMLMVTQERKVYNVQGQGYRGELHPDNLQYILPAAYLLYSHRVLVTT